MDALVGTRTKRTEHEQKQLIGQFVEIMPSLRAFALSLTRSESHAEDLVQTTMLRALESMELFDGRNIDAWLFTILRNLYRSEYRKRKREVEFDPEIAEKILSDGLFQEDMESVQDFNKLLMCLALLTQEQRDAVIAVGYLGLTYEETASILGCAAGTVKSRTNRGREALAANLETYKIVQIDLSPLRNATKGVPRNHPYFVIANACSELFAQCDDMKDGHFVAKNTSPTLPVNESERLWQELVASGALEDDAPSCIQM